MGLRFWRFKARWAARDERGLVKKERKEGLHSFPRPLLFLYQTRSSCAFDRGHFLCPRSLRCLKYRELFVSFFDRPPLPRSLEQVTSHKAFHEYPVSSTGRFRYCPSYRVVLKHFSLVIKELFYLST